MSPIEQIQKTAEGVLRASGSPLALSELSARLGEQGRRPTDTVLLKALKDKPEVFCQVRGRAWALVEWNMSPLDTLEQEIAPIPERAPFPDLIRSLLDHLTPDTQDRRVLNELSSFHIENSTYRVGSVPRHATDANTLVPASLYREARNMMWRYPPMIETSFVVAPDAKGSVKIDVDACFGCPGVIQYQERRPFGPKTAKRRVAEPRVRIPAAFSKLSLRGHEYDLQEGQETERHEPRAFEPRFYRLRLTREFNGATHHRLTTTVQADKAIVRRYLEDNGEVESVLDLDPFSPKGLVDNTDPRAATAFIELQYAELSAALLVDAELVPELRGFRVRVRLENRTPGASEGKKLQSEKAFLYSLVLPHLRIQILQGEALLPPQQHAEAMQHERNHKDHGEEVEPLPWRAQSQTNCVLTRSTRDPRLLLATTFGVYDTLRLEPKAGPKLSTVTSSLDEFLQRAPLLEPGVAQTLRADSAKWENVQAVLHAASEAFRDHAKNRDITLHAFQWAAIQNRLNATLLGRHEKAVVIRAPTGSGKTLVFFVGAALHYLLTGERAVLMFPTRVLNEDMFRRLTRFIYFLRKEPSGRGVTGGIFIGSSDPAYAALSDPPIGQPMTQHERCPQCLEHNIPAEQSRIVAQKQGTRTVGLCENPNCRHAIDYMFHPKEVADYLPALTIATPDKLFYEATLANAAYSTRFFGAPAVRCDCGHHISMMMEKAQVADELDCKACGRKIDRTTVKPRRSPPAYFVFDEVHSLYGITATLTANFLNLLAVLTDHLGCKIQAKFETGTATIANEDQLLRALTGLPTQMLPTEGEYDRYFHLDTQRVRHRLLIMMPVAKSTRAVVTDAVARVHQAMHEGGNLRAQLAAAAKGRFDAEQYDFCLTYLFKKEDGYTIANEVRKQLSDDTVVDFLSGDASAKKMVEILKGVWEKRTELLVANLVISLGVDIHRLNHMLMMGIPQSFTELVQVAGRTGRAEAPGHISVYLLPSNPRDEYVYRYFHRVLSDLRGYFDRKPVAATNAYAAQLILPNAVCALLSARRMVDPRFARTQHCGSWLSNAPNFNNLLATLLLRVLAREASDELRKDVGITAQKRLQGYAQQWVVRDEWLTDWFIKNGHVIWGLRPSSERVEVQVQNSQLYEKMRSAFALASDMEAAADTGEGEE